MGSLSASVTLKNATPYHRTSTQLAKLTLLLYNGLCIVGYFLCDTHTHTYIYMLMKEMHP